MNNDKQKLFSQEEHLSYSELLAYHSHMLSPAEEHKIEKHLTDCTFCSEALHGIAAMKIPLKYRSISDELKRKGRKKYWHLQRKIFPDQTVIILLLLFVLSLAAILTYYFIIILKK
jgi:hypothetical protein